MAASDNPLIRLFVINGTAGAGLGVLMALTLVLFDVRGLGELVFSTDQGFVAFALLGVGLAVTFGGGAIATAVMMISEWDDNP